LLLELAGEGALLACVIDQGRQGDVGDHDIGAGRSDPTPRTWHGRANQPQEPVAETLVPRCLTVGRDLLGPGLEAGTCR
jgi:hypothetical protein